MPITAVPSKASVPHAIWLHLVGVALALLVFTATVYAYLSRPEPHVHGSYLPLVIGVTSFFLLMAALIYIGTSSKTLSGRIAKAAGIALAETIVFFLLTLFIVLNTLGA